MKYLTIALKVIGIMLGVIGAAMAIGAFAACAIWLVKAI